MKMETKESTANGKLSKATPEANFLDDLSPPLSQFPPKFATPRNGFFGYRIYHLHICHLKK